MSPPRTCAIVLHRGDAATEAATRAAGSQSPPPDQIIVATSRRLTAAVRKAMEAAPDWIWLLDGRAVAQPGALAALIDAAAGWPDSRLCLLSSKLVDSDGTLLTAEAPVPQADDADLAVDAFARRTCALRVAGYGSLLVRAGTLRDALPPSGRAGSDLVWSARLLTDGVGLLVPQSVAVRATPSRPRERLGLLAGWARLLLSDAVALSEKPWMGLIYFDRARALIAGWARGHRPSPARPALPSR